MTPDDGNPSDVVSKAEPLSTRIMAQINNCSNCKDIIIELLEDIQLHDPAIVELRAEVLFLKSSMLTLSEYTIH